MVLAKGAIPRQRVLIVGVDERAVDVEQNAGPGATFSFSIPWLRKASPAHSGAETVSATVATRNWH